MKAFRIAIDGEHLGDFGVPNFGVNSVIFTLSKGVPEGYPTFREDHCTFSISGLTTTDETGKSYHFRWSPPQMRVGMRVTVELVESASCIEPVKIEPSDADLRTPEEIFTKEELREMWYEDYLALKKEFEG